MGIKLSYTLEVDWCNGLPICFLVLKKDGVVVASTPPQPMDKKFCMDTLDAIAVLREIPVDERAGLVIQLESAFRTHAEAERRRVVGATPVDELMVGLGTTPVTERAATAAFRDFLRENRK
jgi:hypothetical protein